MIKISKKEKDYLCSKGAKWGYDIHGSSMTHKARAKRYYLTESERNLNMLNLYREEVTV